MKIILFVFFGSGIGGVCRYLVNRWISTTVTSVFPYGTFLVNISGCFLIGFLVFISPRFGSNSLDWRWFLVTGICGGYTTFSSFSFENVQLITDQHVLVMILYTIASIAVGFLATYIGILLARNI